MAGKREPAKLAETGKGCSLRSAAAPGPETNYLIISNACRFARAGTQLALSFVSGLLGSRR
jgi:hypothetical protein